MSRTCKQPLGYALQASGRLACQPQLSFKGLLPLSLRVSQYEQILGFLIQISLC